MNKYFLIGLIVVPLAVASYLHLTCGITCNAKNEFTNLSKDPDSVKFREVREINEYLACGEINGKNGFGAYAGYTRFMYGEITPEHVIRAVDDGSVEFAETFSEVCNK